MPKLDLFTKRGFTLNPFENIYFNNYDMHHGLSYRPPAHSGFLCYGNNCARDSQRAMLRFTPNVYHD